MEKPIWNKLKNLLINLFFEPKEKNEEPQPPPEKGKMSFLHWMMILVCLGLGAMILHNFFSFQEQVQSPLSIPTSSTANQGEVLETIGTSKKTPFTMADYEEMYENQLVEILGKIVGVGEVSVMVNLDSSEQIVVEKNRNRSQQITNEKDREGGNRQIDDQKQEEQVVIIRQGSDEEPVIIMTKKPKVRGVLVVATGTENMQVKAMVTEAVQRVLDVPLHKISVLPKRK
ncbi:stage III sporulation protein AG [Caldalkalibacillus mannanilyticus]|uniref:stage III sporulation protein AG n=1 Tax=Caldalkalibacillus mannanilyticus TaxID=1418 RepID=UPI0004690A10|nr:stage III sporulation protein AG [Caldalkalibacillus mannanilyticus]